MKVALRTLGCKLNQAETDELKNSLLERGFLVVPFAPDVAGRENKVDIVIIRGCAVTYNASQTTRELVRQAKRLGALIIAVGCVENKDLPEIDFVAKVNEDVMKYLALTTPSPLRVKRKGEVQHRTRTFIKIQTGCNFNCTYCVIPSFRGRAMSVPLQSIIEQVNQAIQSGYREAVLTGVNVCAYRDNKNHLADLLKTVLHETTIKRIRLGSLDPRLIAKNFIECFTPTLLPSRLLPHWHLSLQSGSARILQSMDRLYTPEKYLTIVTSLRSLNPLFSFTTDIIVGFPGEIEEDFEATCDFVREVGFTKVHAFPFSPRPGTPAATMPNQVQESIRTKRAKKLTAIAEKSAKKFTAQFIGSQRPVLFEHKRGKYWCGYTPEFIRIRYASAKNLSNKIVDVNIKEENITLL